MANQVLYGFMNVQDIFGQRVADSNLRVINAAVDATLAEHNRQMETLLNLFTFRTTEHQVRFRTPTLARLQPLDESGRARPVKVSGQYDVAFPLQDAGIAWGATYKASQKMTVQEVNDAVGTMLIADKAWMRDHILAALYANASWTFADPQYGDLTVKGLANSDTDIYILSGSTSGGATDTHYLAQAAAIADGADPFPLIHAELTEHPENTGEVVALIPSNLKATVQGLANFYDVADPRLRVGSGVTVLDGTLSMPLPGPIIGYHASGVWIAEWKNAPDSYILATTTEGPRPLAMREEVESSLQGFKRVAQRNDHPFYEDQYLRIAGFGAYNRIAAVVYRIGNAAYAVPTNYSSPMP